MDKKVTIKDVAESAGVSKATVSYILNNREDQSISEATKKKVWQVVNMLNYRPNSFAQNMRVSHEKRMVAFFFPNNPTPLEKLAYFDLIEELKIVFHDKNYEVLLLNNAMERVNTADAIITCGITRKEFFSLGDCNLVPLISVDCRIDDPIFFEIAYDYTKLQETARNYFGSSYTFVDISPRDESIKTEILNNFSDVLFVDRLSDLIHAPLKNVLVVQKSLYEIFSEINSCNVYYPSNGLVVKAQQIAHCVQLAIEHKQCTQHIFQI